MSRPRDQPAEPVSDVLYLSAPPSPSQRQGIRLLPFANWKPAFQSLSFARKLNLLPSQCKVYGLISEKDKWEVMVPEPLLTLDAYLNNRDPHQWSFDKSSDKSQPSWEIPFLLGAKLIRAVTALHQQGFLHRSIQPNNIFLFAGSLLQVSPLAHGTYNDSKKGTRKNTKEDWNSLDFLSGYLLYQKEKGFSTGCHDHSVDLFALGAILYHLFLGESLYAQYKGTSVASRRQYLQQRLCKSHENLVEQWLPISLGFFAQQYVAQHQIDFLRKPLQFFLDTCANLLKGNLNRWSQSTTVDPSAIEHLFHSGLPSHSESDEKSGAIFQRKKPNLDQERWSKLTQMCEDIFHFYRALRLLSSKEMTLEQAVAFTSEQTTSFVPSLQEIQNVQHVLDDTSLTLAERCSCEFRSEMQLLLYLFALRPPKEVCMALPKLEVTLQVLESFTMEQLVDALAQISAVIFRNIPLDTSSEVVSILHLFYLSLITNESIWSVLFSRGHASVLPYLYFFQPGPPSYSKVHSLSRKFCPTNDLMHFPETGKLPETGKF